MKRIFRRTLTAAAISALAVGVTFSTSAPAMATSDTPGGTSWENETADNIVNGYRYTIWRNATGNPTIRLIRADASVNGLSSDLYRGFYWKASLNRWYPSTQGNQNVANGRSAPNAIVSNLLNGGQVVVGSYWDYLDNVTVRA